MYLLCSDWSIRCLKEKEKKENCHLLITAVVPTGAVIKSKAIHEPHLQLLIRFKSFSDLVGKFVGWLQSQYSGHWAQQPCQALITTKIARPTTGPKECYWSALATAPASAGAKEASNSTKFGYCWSERLKCAVTELSVH